MHMYMYIFVVILSNIYEGSKQRCKTFCKKEASHLQETTGVVLLDDLHTVLHQPCGLTELHCAVRDLIPDHLGTKTEGCTKGWE